MRIPRKQRITTALGTYERALETSTHIFYVNFEEGDENASVKMFDRNRVLVSDNYFAYGAMMEEIESENHTWMSKKLLKCLVESN